MRSDNYTLKIRQKWQITLLKGTYKSQLSDYFKLL
nr:MAG TPA: hypothetical protein [Bacteriophage sp.]